MLCYVTLRYVTLRYVTLRYVTLRYVTLRYVMLCYVMLCYVISMEKDYTSVTFINLSMGFLGIIGKDSINLHKLLNTTNVDKNSIA